MKQYTCEFYEADAPDTPIAGQMALTDSPFIYAEYFEPSKEDIENARTVTNCVLPNSEASDWSGRYDACGMYNKEYDGGDMIRLVRPNSAPDTPLEGQESMFND